MVKRRPSDHLLFKMELHHTASVVSLQTFFLCSSDTVAQLMVNILGVKINWAGIAVSIAPPLFFLMHWKQSSNESSLSSPSAIGNQIKASSEKPVPLHKHYSQIKQSFPSLCSDSSMTKVHLWFFSDGTIVVSCTSRELLNISRAPSCTMHANILFASVHVWLERQAHIPQRTVV